jgi:uncharacterized protein YndB with AHSA1/START domain
MKNNLKAETSITIKATPESVWKAITTPASIKKYLMGTTVTSDWEEGSPINYEGEYNGKTYRDKGVIKKFKPESIFQSTYWSSMSGKEDKPENYNTVTYALSDEDDRTLVTLTQDNIATEEEKEHATKNWEQVLQKLKEVVEKQK